MNLFPSATNDLSPEPSRRAQPYSQESINDNGAVKAQTIEAYPDQPSRPPETAL